jgi:hypothetical protein
MTKVWRELYNEEFHDLCLPPNIRMIKTWEDEWDIIAHMGKYKLLMEDLDGRDTWKIKAMNNSY